MGHDLVFALARAISWSDGCSSPTLLASVMPALVALALVARLSALLLPALILIVLLSHGVPLFAS